MPFQRVRGAESRARNSLSNGPLRVQGNVRNRTEYSATRGHASVAGDMLVSRQGHRVIPMKQGGTADKLFYSSLTEEIILSRAIFYSPLTDTD